MTTAQCSLYAWQNQSFSFFSVFFSAMLNIRSILFFMADRDTRPALKWTLKMGQFTMWSLIWESLGSLFFFFTKLNTVLNSSSCSSFQLNRPVNLFFFASEKKKTEWSCYQLSIKISYNKTLLTPRAIQLWFAPWCPLWVVGSFPNKTHHFYIENIGVYIIIIILLS